MSNPIKKQKVLFLITKSNWGGAQRYVYDLATTLDPHEWEPVVACGGNGQLISMLENAGIRTIHIGAMTRDISYRKEWAAIKELWRILQTEQPDVFHVNSSKAGAMGALLGRIARVPHVIFTAHGWAFNEERPFWQRIIIKAIHWFTVVCAHQTIAVSRAVKREMNWLFTQHKMTIIHPGRTIGAMFEREEAREKIISFFPRLAPYQNNLWFLCLAELHPIKQHHILFEAMAKIITTYPQARLICIGDGELRTSLDALIVEKNLAEHIFLTGSITEAARFLKAFDLFLLASRSESYGYVIAEAGLAKVPVIASAVGGIQDIIIDGKRGRLIYPTPDNFVSAITTAFTDSETTKKYSEELYRFLSHNTVTEMTNRTVTIYRGN